MNLVLPDCGASYFTRPEDFQSAFGPLPGKIPVHLGPVPFHRTSRVSVPPEMDSRHHFPLVQNRPLYSFLRGKIVGEEILPSATRRRVPGRRALGNVEAVLESCIPG